MQAQYRRIAEGHGPLSVWREPEEGRDYVIGGDSAGGGARSDPAVLAVIDAESTDLCAVWRDRVSPIPTGRAAFCLGHMYNTALLGIETHPSPHGLAVIHELQRLQYPRIYMRVQQDVAQKTQSRTLGFANNATTSALMVSRVKEWLGQESGSDEHDVLDENLLRELRGAYWDANGKWKSSTTDDEYDAVAIALMVRDDAWHRQELRRYTPVARTIDELVWKSILAPEAGPSRRHAI